MKSVEESALEALSGQDIRLLPYLPYLLQDLWEIGSSSSVILHLLRKNGFARGPKLKVLDLGCGKGAISVPLAHVFGWQVLGIDAVGEFIREAGKKAREYEVGSLCTFEVGDIREEVKKRRGFDMIVLGSIGPVFGNHYETLVSVSQCLNPGGYVIYDDGYIPDTSDYRDETYTTHSELKSQIGRAGMQIVDELIISPDEMAQSDAYMQERIVHRSRELIMKYPDKREMFEGYIKLQEEEIDLLEFRLVCSTLLLKKGN